MPLARGHANPLGVADVVMTPMTAIVLASRIEAAGMREDATVPRNTLADTFAAADGPRVVAA